MLYKTALNEMILKKESQGLEASSIKNYYSILNIFEKWLGLDNFDLSFLTYNVAMSYSRYVYKMNNPPATKKTYLTYFRAFVHYCNDKGYITSFSYKEIVIKKAKKRIVNYLSDSQIKLLFQSVNSSCAWLTLRNKAYMLLMLDSGLRLKDVIGLKHSHLSFENRTAVVLGKGNKYRAVPLGKASIEFIKAYLDICPFKSEYVFVNNKGQQLSAYSIQCFLNRLKHKLGFDISAHKFRHNFSEKFLEDNYARTGSSNVNELQSILGHEDIKTTLIYQNIFNEQLAIKHYQSHYDNFIK